MKAKSHYQPLTHLRPPARLVAILLALLAIAVLVRLPGLSRPLLGNFATKNVVNAMMARNWSRGTAAFWQPTVDCLQHGQRGLHLLEVPLASYAAGLLWRIFGGSLDLWGRLSSTLFSVAAVYLLYRLVLRWHGRVAALVSATLLALSPISITYGQSFLLEPSVVFLSLATLACLVRSLDPPVTVHRAGSGSLFGRTYVVPRETRLPKNVPDPLIHGQQLAYPHRFTSLLQQFVKPAWLLLAAVCFACLLLTKIYMLVLLLPIAGLVVHPQHSATSPLRRVPHLLLLVAASLPALAWCLYVWRHTANPTAAPHIFYSLRNSAHVHAWPHPLLHSPAFYQQLATSLATVVLTPVGALLALVGLFHLEARRHYLWLASAVLLVFALPLKYHELNYYFLPLLPPLAILAGLGAQLIRQRWRPRPLVLGAGALLFVAFSARYTVRPAFVTPAEDQNVLAAAGALQQLAAPHDPVVALHGSAPDLLYYCDRPGWAVPLDHPHLRDKLVQCQRDGARYLVVARPECLDATIPRLDSLNLLARHESYAIYALSGHPLAPRSPRATADSPSSITRR